MTHMPAVPLTGLCQGHSRLAVACLAARCRRQLCLHATWGPISEAAMASCISGRAPLFEPYRRLQKQQDGSLAVHRALISHGRVGCVWLASQHWTFSRVQSMPCRVHRPRQCQFQWQCRRSRCCWDLSWSHMLCNGQAPPRCIVPLQINPNQMNPPDQSHRYEPSQGTAIRSRRCRS